MPDQEIEQKVKQIIVRFDSKTVKQTETDCASLKQVAPNYLEFLQTIKQLTYRSKFMKNEIFPGSLRHLTSF